MKGFELFMAFDIVILNSWSSLREDGQPGHTFIKKLKSLSNQCKLLNTKVFRKEFEQMESITKSINDIDEKEEINKRLAVKIDLQNLSLFEARKWKQLCKFKWLKEVDENTCKFPRSLSINLQKSNFLGINLEPQSINEIERIWGCHATKLPLNYLGMPLGGNPKVSSFWDPVVEKIDKKTKFMEIDPC